MSVLHMCLSFALYNGNDHIHTFNRHVLLVTSDNSSDVTGVEIAGALKNVLAIAAGIVEGMDLGNNCMAALVAQGCSEIRWLATKVSYLLLFPYSKSH